MTAARSPRRSEPANRKAPRWMRNRGATAFSLLVANQNAPGSTVAVGVIAVVRIGVAIPVDINAITSPAVAIASIAAIAAIARVAAITRVAIAGSGNATSTTSDASTCNGTSGAGARSRSTVVKARRRATDARDRREETDARERRRTTDAWVRRKTTEAGDGRNAEWKSQRGIRRVYCSAKHRASGQRQKRLAQHSCISVDLVADIHIVIWRAENYRARVLRDSLIVRDAKRMFRQVRG
jgi:hypothetical protein